jgi:lipoprotein NlpD
VLVLATLVLVAPARSTAQGTQRGIYHRVQRGESFELIARRYRVSVYDIARANRLNPNHRLVAGSALFIPGARAPVSSVPVVEQPRRVVSASTNPPARPAAAPDTVTVRRGESLWAIAKRHGTTVAALAAANGLHQDAALEVSQVLRLPGGAATGGQGGTSTTGGARESAGESRGGAILGPASPPAPPPRETRPPAGSSNPGRPSARGFIWPAEGPVTREYENTTDSKHFGVDIAVPVGTPVRAARDGTVVYSSDSITAYGNMVIIEHDGGLASCYAFNERNAVRENQRVRRGDVVAYSGNDGNTAQPRVHFQIRRNGDAVNPRPYLP